LLKPVPESQTILCSAAARNHGGGSSDNHKEMCKAPVRAPTQHINAQFAQAKIPFLPSNQQLKALRHKHRLPEISYEQTLLSFWKKTATLTMTEAHGSPHCNVQL